MIFIVNEEERMGKKLWIGLIVIVVLIFILLLLIAENNGDSLVEGECSQPLEVAIDLNSRPFYMGFTTWPPDFTIEAVNGMYEFIGDYADIIGFHFDGGVPWPEALNGEDFSNHLTNEWEGARDKKPSNHKLYVAITPLDISRENLASYWGSDTGQPLPSPWNSYSLNDEEVKTAFLNYAKRVIDFFNPDYLAIGIEVNILLTRDQEKWEQYLELHEYIYAELKKDHPELPIFASVSLAQINGLDQGNPILQKEKVSEFMQFNDFLGISTYPYGWAYWPAGKLDPVPEDFFDTFLIFGKPIAVTETGAPSQDFSALGTNYKFDENYQRQYIELLLRKAHEYDFEFVINWANIDYDKLLEIFPDKNLREFATIWAYTGLQRSDGCKKKALYVWDAYLKLPKI